jgi:hypothetical protein
MVQNKQTTFAILIAARQIMNALHTHTPAIIFFQMGTHALFNEYHLYVCLVLNFDPQYVGLELMKKQFDLLIAPLSTKI